MAMTNKLLVLAVLLLLLVSFSFSLSRASSRVEHGVALSHIMNRTQGLPDVLNVTGSVDCVPGQGMYECFVYSCHARMGNVSLQQKEGVCGSLLDRYVFEANDTVVFVRDE